MVTLEEMKNVISYNPILGVFTKLKTGAAVGYKNKKNGYFYVSIWRGTHKTQQLGHRLAWLWVYGEWPTDRDIDHIDNDRTNNVITNLRLATRSQNLGNSRMKAQNRSGYKGVHYVPSRGYWRSRITFQGKEILLGHFNDPKLAHDAYVAAAIRLFGEFARAA